MASKRNTRVFTPIFIFSLILCALSIPLCYMVWVQIANLSTGPDFGSVAYSDSIYQMLPKFAPLNAQVLAELPPPPGVELTNLNNLTDKKTTSSWGGAVHLYEVSLDASYIINDQSPGQVSSYYRNMLLSQGWTEDSNSAGTPYTGFTFHRGTACVNYDLSTQAMNGGVRYSLTIWYDFWSQSFSVQKPPDDMLWRFQTTSCPE